MKFNWDGFTERAFVDYCARIENNMAQEGDYIGCVRIGDLCFDLMIREYNDEFTLDYDLYVGGCDTGYGYSKDGYPYTDDGGGSFEDTMIGLPYDDFRTIANGTLEDFIRNEDSTTGFSLVEKANEPLHIW